MSDRDISDGKRAALRRLKLAYDRANEAAEDTCQFALTMADLRPEGATPDDLVWLIKNRYAKHLVEVTHNGREARQFRAADSLPLRVSSCFVLTYAGFIYAHMLSSAPSGPVQERPSAKTDQLSRRKRAAPEPERRAADQLQAERGEGGATQLPPATINGTPDQAVPVWRSVEGDLYFRGELARRRGRKLAKLEESLLTAFQTAKWPRAIPNPINVDEAEANEQAKEAVRRLNKSLLCDNLLFHAPGEGAIVSWEEVTRPPLADSRSPSAPRGAR